MQALEAASKALADQQELAGAAQLFFQVILLVFRYAQVPAVQLNDAAT